MDRLSRIAGHVNAAGGAPTSPGLRPEPTRSSPIVAILKGKVALLAEKKVALKAELLQHGNKKLQDATVDMCINGARSMKAMVTETSDLDPTFGISYRGRSLYECAKLLPKAPNSDVALPEAALWLLLTDEVPGASEVKALSAELHARSAIPDHVQKTMEALPKDMHPMTQLSISLLALQKHSQFNEQYDKGMAKDEYWEWALEDTLDICAKIPVIAARIYRRSFKDGKYIEPDTSLDWAANFAKMLGISDAPDFFDVTRLYLMLHADHEGGNVSAHTTHLVGSALSDPYYAWSAGICGLAGPLHGLANQECLAWLLEVQEELGGAEPTEENITALSEKKLASGQVIPGYGHAVLRKTDPRYMLERDFALKHCKDDPLFKLVDACFHAIPAVLEKKGKVKNPNPNVDAHSGQLMYYYGLKETNFYTVVFAVSRTLGVLSQYVWSRVLKLPIERPKSVTLESLRHQVLPETDHDA